MEDTKLEDAHSLLELDGVLTFESTLFTVRASNIAKYQVLSCKIGFRNGGAYFIQGRSCDQFARLEISLTKINRRDEKKRGRVIDEIKTTYELLHCHSYDF